MTSTKTPDATATVIPAEAYEAYAAYMRTGGTVSFMEWLASDSGQAALTAFQDQATAAAKAARMADAKAIWRDFKENGEGTIYARAHAARMLAYLSTVDFDAITAEATPAS